LDTEVYDLRPADYTTTTTTCRCCFFDVYMGVW